MLKKYLLQFIKNPESVRMFFFVETAEYLRIILCLYMEIRGFLYKTDMKRWKLNFWLYTIYWYPACQLDNNKQRTEAEEVFGTNWKDPWECRCCGANIRTTIIHFSSEPHSTLVWLGEKGSILSRPLRMCTYIMELRCGDF
jgi:hypothetical protein